MIILCALLFVFNLGFTSVYVVSLFLVAIKTVFTSTGGHFKDLVVRFATVAITAGLEHGRIFSFATILPHSPAAQYRAASSTHSQKILYPARQEN